MWAELKVLPEVDGLKSHIDKDGKSYEKLKGSLIIY